ncbi:flavodoxin [Fredinandcohnia quinoae]|uniref:Flavodoxin n=1 Tax=Fredinandcohnia quinoae TaxID=2918902 RepID=A0AAW5DUK9_9BACI|nr:flavodoxin [Fredinandcohnia sp. SECRCQ15]MCH1624316.1 flavodoxin [Fredinandcohnia sp. SECRCQ15]
MKKVIIIYTSMSGNTEMMATAIADGIQKAGLQVVVKDSFEAIPDEMLDYDGIMIGSYTWGEGEIPDEFLDFYEELDELDLSSKRCAVFGSCSSLYSHFGGAVDSLREKLVERGTDIIQEPLKIELTPNSLDQEICKKYGEEFGRIISQS